MDATSLNPKPLDPVQVAEFCEQHMPAEFLHLAMLRAQPGGS